MLGQSRRVTNTGARRTTVLTPYPQVGLAPAVAPDGRQQKQPSPNRDSDKKRLRLRCKDRPKLNVKKAGGSGKAYVPWCS